MCGDSSPRCKLDLPSPLSTQPSHRDVMLALHVTANHKVNNCTKLGMTHSHYMLVRHLSHDEAEGMVVVILEANKAAKQLTAF